MTTTHPPMHCTAYVLGDPDGCARCGEREDQHERPVGTDRTVAAEARFVEEGHHTFIGHDAQGHFVRIVSDILGHTGKSWRVRAHVTGPGLPVIFTCCPDGDTRDGHPEHSSLHGITDCKHMAGAARRLEREGLAELLPPGRYGDLVLVHSRWIATDKACARPDGAHLFEAGSADPNTMDRRAAMRASALRAAAEGKDGDVFAGFPS